MILFPASDPPATVQKFDRVAGRSQAGLFDYFSDRVFQAALRRLLPAVADGGELIIGNFTSGHRSQAYMEFAGWFLHHRSGEQLTALA